MAAVHWLISSGSRRALPRGLAIACAVLGAWWFITFVRSLDAGIPAVDASSRPRLPLLGRHHSLRLDSAESPRRLARVRRCRRDQHGGLCTRLRRRCVGSCRCLELHPSTADHHVWQRSASLHSDERSCRHGGRVQRRLPGHDQEKPRHAVGSCARGDHAVGVPSSAHPRGISECWARRAYRDADCPDSWCRGSAGASPAGSHLARSGRRPVLCYRFRVNECSDQHRRQHISTGVGEVEGTSGTFGYRLDLYPPDVPGPWAGVARCVSDFFIQRTDTFRSLPGGLSQRRRWPDERGDDDGGHRPRADIRDSHRGGRLCH